MSGDETKAAKARKPRAPPTHPPYIEMISEAIKELKERTGSSLPAITKFIDQKYGKGEEERRHHVYAADFATVPSLAACGAGA